MRTPSKIDELVRTQFLMGLIRVLIAIKTYENCSSKLDVNGEILVDELNQAMDYYKLTFENMRRAVKNVYAPLVDDAFNNETKSLYKYALAVTGMSKSVFKSYDFC